MIPTTTPSVDCGAGTLASPSAEWTAIADFYGQLYSLLARHANQNKLALDVEPLAPNVERDWLNAYFGAYVSLQQLTAIKNLGTATGDPILLDFSSTVFQRRHRIDRLREQMSAYPIPPLYKQWLDYMLQPVTMGPGKPFMMGVNNNSRAIRDLSTTSDVESILNGVDTILTGLEDSGDKRKFLNALQTFRPGWATQLADIQPTTDPERVLMWRTRALRNSNGATDRQSPNAEDNAIGNGSTKAALFTYGAPHPFQFTGLVPGIKWEKDDKGSGAGIYGSCSLVGASGDDADQPSELDFVYGRVNATVGSQPLDYAQGVSDVGQKWWNAFYFTDQTFSDDPGDYFDQMISEDVQYYELDLDDIAVETRKMLTASWDFPL
jgi:hypothetical protein